MGYYNGTANGMVAMRTALVAACVSEGWAWNSSTEMLSKGAIFLRMQVVSGFLTLLGRTAATSGDAPSLARMGRIDDNGPEITYPAEYQIFVFSGEVYCVIRFNVDCHIWCAFGQSTVSGLPGTGMWVAASVASVSFGGLEITPTRGGSNSFYRAVPAPFWRTVRKGINGDDESYVHSNLDDQGWWAGQALSVPGVGIPAAMPLISVLPNSWNSEAVLIPIRAYKIRPSSKLSLTVDLEHARYTRVDNYVPGQIISLGLDRWIIFPFYRKNSSVRDGGSGVDHTGTLGWAIRYEGP